MNHTQKQCCFFWRIGKTLTAVVLVFALLLTMAAPCQGAGKKQRIRLKAVNADMYFLSASSKYVVTLYFKNGGDIPYVALEEWPAFFTEVNKTYDADYDIFCVSKGTRFSYLRENGYDATFDFNKKTLHFTDRDAFFRKNNSSFVGGDAVSPSLMSLIRKDDSSYVRYGYDTTIDFKAYGIDIFAKGKKHFIPLQTLSDLFVSLGMGAYIVYNGDALFCSNKKTLPWDMEAAYLEGKRVKRSKAFTAFNYGELCMALDYLYGMMDAHKIASFDRFFTNSGLIYDLKRGEDAGVDKAVYDMINYLFDDLHSSFGTFSYNSDYRDDPGAASDLLGLPKGAAVAAYIEQRDRLKEKYEEYYPYGTKAYEEVGDTAYLKFDSFEYVAGNSYQRIPTEKEAESDCLCLMQYACDRILRKDSPVKRVVLDLSMNGGGAFSAAMYVMGTFLGKSRFSVRDTKTGGSSHAFYDIDTNLDGKFDERDTLAGKGLQLFCIISPVSFSCGNLVPCMFKETGDVTLIGQQSGGGACDVQPLCTAGGTIFQVSGHTQISFSKNGSFYDVDRGAAPDVYVKDVGSLYDREYANSVLDSIL